MSITRVAPALALAVYAGSAAAHPGHHEAAGFVAGFAHPLGGADHLLAMLAVGLYAARQPGAARWALPAAFVLAMLAGAGLSAAGVHLPAVEAGIALSVLALGLLLAFVVRLPLVAAVPMVAAFAVFHGYAHHTEMGGNGVLGYVGGFALATAMLHGAGYLLASRMADSGPAAIVRRLAGGLIAGAGLVLLGA